MSETQQNCFADYSAMTTEELEEILRLDAEGTQTDEELLLHIMDLLVQRRQNSGNPEKSVDDAWQTFQTHYTPRKNRQKFAASKNSPLLRFVAAAAAAVIILVIFPLTAKALGWGDMWGAVAQWAKDTFSVADPTEPTQQFTEPTPPPSTPTEPAPLPETVEQDGIFYELGYQKKYTVTGAIDGLSGDVEIPATVKGRPVVAIDKNAFQNQENLTGIVLPNSITTIGFGAFSQCTALKNVTLPDGLTNIEMHVFNGCTALTSITIPNTVTRIGGWAFAVTGLTAIEIPGSIEIISDNLFRDCTALKKVVLQEGVKDFYAEVFSGCTGLTEIHIPNSMYAIHGNTFKDCISLTTIIYPDGPRPLAPYETEVNGMFFRLNDTSSAYTLYDSTEEISGNIEIPITVNGLPVTLGTGAFAKRPKLTGIVIPDNITTIPGSAFHSCTALKTVTLPEGLKQIESYAFKYCTALTSISIPETVKYIGASAFMESGLTHIEIPGGVEKLHNSVFLGCSSLQTVVLNDGLKTLDYRVFCKCTALSEITIPASVTRIENEVFAYCSGLTRITIWGRITHIEKGMFIHSPLTDITLPSSLVSIGKQVFYSRPAVQNVLQNIYYDGTQEEWNRIYIDSFNEPLKEAKLHFIEKCAGGHAWDEGTDITTATCIASGEKRFTCTACGLIRTEIIPQLTEHNWDFGTETMKPVCDKSEGKKVYTCRTCGVTRTEVIPIPEAHSWHGGHLTKYPVCGKTAGEKTYYCIYCNVTKIETTSIPEQHNWNTGTVTTQPTCAQEGVRTFFCSTCLSAKTESIPKITTHKWDQGSLVKPPTCKETGQWAMCCTLCGEIKETKTVVKLEHIPGPEATFIKPQTCTACGTVLSPARNPFIIPFSAALITIGGIAVTAIIRKRKNKQ